MAARKKNEAKQESNPEAHLAAFLAKFTPDIAKTAEQILRRMRTRLPGAVELVYDNYNALAIASHDARGAGSESQAIPGDAAESHAVTGSDGADETDSAVSVEAEAV